jgi:hypothetical protein
VHEWNNIPQAFIQRLTGSMRRRCDAVVAARGGHTRYWTPQTSILHDNFCLSMICSDTKETIQGFDAQYFLHREKKSTKIV